MIFDVKRKRILLIEDDEPLRESTAIFLNEEGFEVFTSKNGGGIKKILELQPDLILCDISMPRMNGYEVSRFIFEK